jgi:Protein of unknown function (DUF3102)
MSPAKTPTTTPDKLAIEINLLNEQVIQSRNQTLIYAARAGAKMIEAKKLVGNGNFINWLEKNITVTRQYATNYMKLAKDYPQLLNDQTAHQGALQYLDVTKAIALITAPDDVKQTVMLRLENGETVTVADIKKLKQQAAQLANANDINAELAENLNAKQKELDSVENQLDDLIKDGGIDRIIEQKETETQIIIGEMAQRQDQLKDQISRLKNEQEKTIQQRVDAELAKRKNDITNLEAQKTTLNHDYINNGFKSASIILIDQIQAFWALIERQELQAAQLDEKTISHIITASNEGKMLSAKLEDIATQTLENVPSEIRQ